MPSRVQQLTLTALTCVLGVLLCLAETASGAAITSPTKTASGEFFGTTPFCTGEIVEESLQPRRGEAASPTELASGRRCWLSPDPLGEAGGINLYGYVGNDPINLWDPLGLAPPAWCVQAAGAVRFATPTQLTQWAAAGSGPLAAAAKHRQAAYQAAHRLGINFTQFVNSVPSVIRAGRTPFTRIDFTKSISRADINAVKESIKCIDKVKDLTIGTGKLANPGLEARLRAAAASGKEFLGGVVRTGSPTGSDDFYIYFSKL